MKVEAAEVCLACARLPETLAWFVDELDFDGASHSLAAADAFVIPPGRVAWLAAEWGLELFELRVRG